MQKLAAFFLSNTKIELNYCGIEKTATELQRIIQDSEVFEDDNYEFLEEAASFENGQINYEEEGNLEIESLVNLNLKKIMLDLDKKI